MKRSVGGTHRYPIIELRVQVTSGTTRNRRRVNPAEEPTDRPTRTWILLKIIPVARRAPKPGNANAAADQTLCRVNERMNEGTYKRTHERMNERMNVNLSNLRIEFANILCEVIFSGSKYHDSLLFLSLYFIKLVACEIKSMYIQASKRRKGGTLRDARYSKSYIS